MGGTNATDLCPEGAEQISPGQRPGTASRAVTRPEPNEIRRTISGKDPPNKHPMEVGRMLAPKADVIVMVSDDFKIVLRCLQSVLQYSGPTLRRLIVIDDHGPESEIAEALNRLAEGDGRVYRVGNSSHPHGFAGSCNRGLSARGRRRTAEQRLHRERRLAGRTSCGGSFGREDGLRRAADQRGRNLFRGRARSPPVGRIARRIDGPCGLHRPTTMDGCAGVVQFLHLSPR